MAHLRTLTSMVGIQAAGAVLSFVSVLALTMALGAESYGLYAWIVSIGSVAALVLQRGLPTTIVKRFSPLSLTTLEAPSSLASTQATYVLAAAVTLPLTVVVALMARPSGTGDAIWALPIAFAMAGFAVADAILRSAHRGVQAQFAGQVLRPGLLLVGTLALWLTGRTGASPYLALYAATFLVATVAFLWPLVAMGLTSWRDGGQVRSNAAHFQVSLARSVGNYLPVFITGFFVEPEILAYLAIAIRVTGPTRFGLNAARTHFGARINSAIKEQDFGQARAEYHIAARFSFAIASFLAVLAIAMVYALAILKQGPFASFDPVLLTTVLAITALSHLAFAMFGPSQLIAILLGDDDFVRKLNVIFLALFALGLLLAALSQQIVLSAFVMVLYSLGVASGAAWRVRTCFTAQQRAKTEQDDAV